MSKTVGIIGFGAFGKTLAQLLAPSVEVLVYDTHTISGSLHSVRVTTLQNIAKCDIIILAVTLDNLSSACLELAELVSPATLVMDVCSVKVKPAKILKQTLNGKCRLLATHPLFGPESVKSNNGTAKGLSLVWHELTDHSFEDAASLLTTVLGVKIVLMSPKDHDKEMAWVHALTFFTGRTLLHMQPPQSKLATRYYKKLMDLVELEAQHSEDLFMTIQRGNPYADSIRKQFLQSAQKLEQTITKEIP